MQSRHNRSNDDQSVLELIERMKARVRDIVARHAATRLVELLNESEKESTETQARIADLNAQVANVPEQTSAASETIREALRKPAGCPQVVRIEIAGRKVKAVLHPLGYAAPERERAVWEAIRERVTRGAA